LPRSTACTSGVFGPAAPTGTRERASTSWPFQALSSFAFAALVLIARTIPSDATRDIPARYGHWHTGLSYSNVYPRIGTELQMVSQATP